MDAGSETEPEPETETDEGRTERVAQAYWRANVRLLLILSAIWFACSFGAGILFREWLDRFAIAGYPLGFWFAQQGSIYVFIALIVYYVWKMKRIERKYDLDD